MNCLFCDIINKNISSEIIAETKFAFAFNDINPKSLIHMLIVPKIHLDSALDLNDSNIHYFSEMILLANKLANKYSFDDKGFRWVINTGNDGGQTVQHLHLHLLAGRKLNWPPG